MYEGDRSRKKNLIDYGFRLPSAFDNRPLKYEEFTKFLKPQNKAGANVIYVSATPAAEELRSSSQIVEQIIRPTGLVDPPIEIRKSTGQIEDLMSEINATTKQGNRALVTTLTKRMAEELATYFLNHDIKVEFLHNERSLIQTIGRAARNVDSKVIFYADKETVSMKLAIKETERRRNKQIAHNKKYGITPQTIKKAIKPTSVPKYFGTTADKQEEGEYAYFSAEQLVELELEMQAAAENLDFEKAIELRDRVKKLKQK